LIDSYVESTVAGTEKFNLPALDVSTSVDNQGVVHVTIANISADDAQQIDCPFALDGKNISARILRGNINDYNDFEEQNRVRVENYTGIRVDENGFSFLMPACSIMEIVIG
jgi:alpha-N-arabinofuranosidase